MTDHTDDRDEVIKYTADMVTVRLRPMRVAVVRRRWDPFKDEWAIPGGHVNKGEKAIHAAVREAREETGLVLYPQFVSQLATYDDPDRDPRGRYVSQAFLTVIGRATPLRAADDAREAAWLPVNELGQVHDPATGDWVNPAFDHASILADAYDRLHPLR